MHKSLSFNDAPLKAKIQKAEILRVTSSVIDSGVFFGGPQVEKLEKRLTNQLEGSYVTSLASGHDALFLALSALRLDREDEVLFPVNALPTAFPIVLSGARAIPVDVDENGQLDPEDLSKKVSKRSKALVVVHLYGLVGALDQILHVAKKRLTIIEDCAQAFGSSYKGKPVGIFGDISCFSFYPTKNVGTLGDGGAIATRNKKLYNFFLKAKSYGEKKKFRSEFPSFHSRIPEIQAGIINVFLDSFREDSKRRSKVENHFLRLLSEDSLKGSIQPLLSHPQSRAVRHLFVAQVKKRTTLRNYLKRRGVQTEIHYPIPVHRLPAFAFIEKGLGEFPMAEKLSKNILSFPFHPFLTLGDVEYIVDLLQKFYKK